MRWVARKTTSISTTAWTSPRPLSSASSNTVSAFSRSGTLLPANSRPMAPPGHQGPREVAMSAARRSSLASRFFLHRAEIGVVAGLVPGRRDGLGDQRRLDVVDGAPPPGHPADDAGEHGETLFPVVAVMLGRAGVDHGEGVEAGRVLAEGDERAFQGLGRVLERPPVVDHHGLAAGADQAGDQLLHQHRLARARLAGDRDVVVAGLVGEGRPARRLAAPADEEQGRRVVRIRRLPGRATRRAAGLRLTALDVSSVFIRPMRSRSASRPPADAIGRQASQEGSCM